MKSLLSIFLLLISSEIIAEATIPAGWRLTVRNDYSAEEQQNFGNKIPNQVEADFNGDGIEDHAWLLLERHHTIYALVIALSTTGKDYQEIILHSNNFSGLMPMGIALLPPTTVQVLCEKNDDCGKNNKKPFKLPLPGLQYFMFESGASVFYWNEAKHQFERIWLSD